MEKEKRKGGGGGGSSMVSMLLKAPLGACLKTQSSKPQGLFLVLFEEA